MHTKYRIANSLLLLLAFGLIITSCKKLDRPALGDYPTDDQNLPAGNLRFYTPFDLTGDEFRYQVADSISTNPSFFDPSPLTLTDGVRGKAIKGSDAKAIQYLNANDWGKSSSFTVSTWLKNSVPTGGKAQFAFTLGNKDFWCNCSMFVLFDHTNSGATVDSAVIKFYMVDNKGEKWFELTGPNRMPKIYDGAWHHLVFTYDETTSNMIFYRDGVAYHTINWAGHGKFEVTPTSLGRFVLGGMNKHAGVAGPQDDWMQSWQGGMDQFRLYNKALSATEIQALYNSRQ